MTRQPRWLQAAGEGRLADHVAGQAHRRGVEAGGQRDAAAFGLAAHRHDAEMLAQHLGAAFVHHARRGADLRVGVAAEVLADEVDQTRVALQQRQQLQRGVGAGLLQRRRGRRRRGRGRRRDRTVAYRVEASRQRGVAEHAEEGAEGQ